MNRYRAVEKLLAFLMFVALCACLDPSARAATRTRNVHPTPLNPLIAGSTLLHVMAGITNASASNPWLIKLDAGVFDLGSSSLVMKPYVDIEGSGEGVTKITAVGSASSNAGTVVGASNAEIRLLTVASTVNNPYSTAFFVPYGTSPKLTHVTLLSTPGFTGSIGMYSVGTPTLTDVTVNLPAGGQGIQLSGGELLQRVNVTVAPGFYNNGIEVFSPFGSPYTPPPTTIIDSTIKAGLGISVGSISTVIVKNSTIVSSSDTINNDGGNVSIANSQLVGSVLSIPGGPTYALNCVGDYNGSYSPLNSSCQ